MNRVVHWISDGGARQAVEGYVVLFRRGNVVALLVVRAAVGAVRLAEILDMATGWDNRIRELSSA
ncbi:MAG TPA: hypothetical protein VNM43_07730 [Dehalococcoidia bacterium]|nr:hypothetical protein [Dehalococcoidia bacterium]